MASRDYLKHVVATSEPTDSTLGDEWYNPSTNILSKRLVINGTTVRFVPLGGGLAVQQSGSTIVSNTSTLNFPGASVAHNPITGVTDILASGVPGGLNTQIQFNNSGAFAGSSNLTWNNSSQTLALTGFLTTFALSRSGNVNAVSWTTASPVFNSAAAVLTDTTGFGTIAIKAGNSFLSPNFASTASTTITDAVNLYVNAAVASTNTTITNNWSLYVAGNQRITGTLFSDADIQLSGSRVVDFKNSTSQWSISGGGVVTWTGSSVLWNQRILVIPVARSIMSSAGFFEIACPTSGTVTYFNSVNVTTTVTATAAGIPLAAYDALYYELNVGGSNASEQTRFRVVNYLNSTWRPSTGWILIAAVNGDGTNIGHLKWLPGQVNLPTTGATVTYNTGTGVASWANATGTVTSVSVASANGFAGTVATASSTPAITISTSITGLLKGNGTAISAATAGTDYQTAQSVTGIVKSSGTTRSAAVAGTDYSAGTSALGTGILKSTTTTGALSIAVAGTDYVTPAATFFIGTTSIAHNRTSANQSLTGINIDGNAGTASFATTTNTLRQTDGTSFLNPIDPRVVSGSRATSLNANQYAQGLFSEFKNSGTFSFTGNYTGLITYANWVGTAASTGDPTYQLAFHPSAANATANPSLKFRAGIDTTWGAWGEISHTQKTDLNIQYNSIGVGVAGSTTAGQLSVSYQAALNTTTPGLVRYGIHLQGQTTADQANGITWNGGTGTTAAQAGIYVQGSGSYGTKMYIATTDSYATGSQTAISIDQVGAVQIARNNLTVNVGYIIQSIAAALTAAGTTQGTALQLVRQINNVTVVAASTGVLLPVAVAGVRVLVRNGGANILRIYPASGGQINTLGANIALQLETNALLELVAFSTTQWYTVNATFA